MGRFKLDFVTPERLLYSAEVEQIIVPGSEGEFTILSEHSPIISSLKPGFIKIYEELSNEPIIYFVTDGFIDMASNQLTILAQSAIEKGQLTAKKLEDIINMYQGEVDITENDIKKNKLNLKIDTVKALQNEA
ncbi:ATP synthase F1 subunit epsilon [Gammaproteobacteria bacterium]|nr:ATP synthase F1 subunit epsilon [Rhodobiaceae bacterium]MDC3084755.1 ATP synthase F1 subunit epsilon [Gammaproteobacteria bacterium]OUT82143.1 MAG: ATP synthase F1 subunit epsilon [Rhizobiales bacterium TMED28]RZO34293.1 MAG: ATP synthase F1 subunit epsilon [Hyphomicrobiales bacterium]|tara:strand:- start:1418 stop:1816 length:399 start_codon:yes stop_codon:yes gene_type:complete